MIAVNQTTLGPLRSETLYFHVRAVDWAGNLGKIATFVLHIDHRAPVLAHAFRSLPVQSAVRHVEHALCPDKTVQVTVKIRQQQTQGIVRIINLGRQQAGVRVSVLWDGRDQGGTPVHAGLYTLEIYAVDVLGNVGDVIYTDLGVNYKRIVVHLSTQSLDVYDGTTLLRHTLVTTGTSICPRRRVWHVLAKFHPYSFISPWPKSSPYWYPTSGVNYALNFHSGGYFIHDAPWRGVFGPGTNAAPGLPGSGIYAGSHGCVETPIPFAQWLYNWAPIGTVVTWYSSAVQERRPDMSPACPAEEFLSLRACPPTGETDSPDRTRSGLSTGSPSAPTERWSDASAPCAPRLALGLFTHTLGLEATLLTIDAQDTVLGYFLLESAQQVLEAFSGGCLYHLNLNRRDAPSLLHHIQTAR